MSICHVYKNTLGVQLVWTTRNFDAFAPAGPSMDIECGWWTHIAAVYDYITGRARYGRLMVHSHWPKANAKRNVFFDFCRCSVWPLNGILYDLAVMSLSLHFRPNINEALWFIHTGRNRARDRHHESSNRFKGHCINTGKEWVTNPFP